MIRVLIFNEFICERVRPAAQAMYPEGIHKCLKDRIEDENIRVETVTQDDIDTITDERLNNTDVLIWWGHLAHNEVPDDVAERVVKAVNDGMGFIGLHSAHHSKIFKRLMGTNCNLTWRREPDEELVWVVNPFHPIAQGLGRYIHLEADEAYGEPFSIPEPDELVFIGSYKSGEVIRSGCCYHRGGNIFYFQPGHETCGAFYHPDVIRVIKNAIYWAKPVRRTFIDCPCVKTPAEELAEMRD